MKRINHNNDFLVILTPKSCTGIEEVIAIPAGDFKIIFRCGGEEYVCGRKSGVYRHCKLNNDGTLTCVFNNHGLLPGVLKMEVWFYNPNSAYPDDNQLTVSPEYALDVELTEEICDEGVTFNADLMMPFAIITAYQMAVKAGYKGTEEEWMRLMSHGFPKVVQQTGDSAEDVMSQKATTDALAVRDAALQEHIDKMRAELMEAYCLMLVGENPVFVGSSVNYTIQATITETADTVKILRNGTEIGSAESVRILSVSDTPPLTERGKITYAARAVIGGTMKEGRLEVNVVLPVYVGAGQSAQAVMTPANRLTARTEPKGACSVRVDRAGDWLWIAVPDNMTFAGAEMGGFELPFSLTDDYVKDYKVYRSDSAYKAGTMEIKLL